MWGMGLIDLVGACNTNMILNAILFIVTLYRCDSICLEWLRYRNTMDSSVKGTGAKAEADFQRHIIDNTHLACPIINHASMYQLSLFSVAAAFVLVPAAPICLILRSIFLYAHSKKGYKNGPVQTEMISSYFGGVSGLLPLRYASGTTMLHIRTHIKPIIINSIRFHMICRRHGCHLMAVDLLVPMLFFVHSTRQWE